MRVSIGFLLLFLHGLNALQWSSESQDADNLVRCSGDNVTFPWSYVTEGDEQVMVVFWWSQKNGSFASYFANKFHPSSERVTLTGKTRLSLSDLSKADGDRYSISVKLYSTADPVTKYVNLTVVDPPRIVEGELRVVEDTANTSGSHIRLKCGKFLSLGFPPLSVTWTDPSGRQLPGTDFADGYFYLEIPEDAQEGNYTCSLDAKEEAAKCIPGGSLLNRDAVFLFESMEAAVAEQAVKLKKLGSETRILDDKVQELSSMLSNQRMASSQRNETINDILRRMSDLEKVNDDLRETNAELQSRTNALEEELQAMKNASEQKELHNAATLKTLEVNLQQNVSLMETHISELTKTNEASLVGLREKTELLQSRQANLTDIVLTETESLRRLVAGQNKTLTERVDQYEMLQQHVDEVDMTWKNALEQLRGDVGNTKQHLQAEEHARTELANLIQARIDDVNSTLTQYVSVANTVTSLQTTVQALRSNVTALQGDLEEISARNDQREIKAAFHAVMKRRMINANQPIAFDLVRDVGGGYDARSGVFTAPVAGWYYFVGQLFPHNTVGTDIWMDLMLDGRVVARGVCYEKASGSFTCRTGLCLHLDARERVWLQSHFAGPFWTSPFDNFFSGFLVSPDDASA